jgi:hypothetical protein
MDPQRLLRRIRFVLGFFLVALFISGLTAIPLRTELSILDGLAGTRSPLQTLWPSLAEWISRVRVGLETTYSTYPFMAYGTDWLAFGHFVIAIAFIGPIRDPSRNVWVIELGILACILLVPYAVIFGIVRGIPAFWTLVDSLFGLLGVVPLLIARRWAGRLPSTWKQSNLGA